jgi:ribosome-associated toxin RatA of RatAB toxin-antitoxin module
MNDLTIQNKELAKPFMWRMSNNRGMIAIRAMATRHLFNTLRMVWNMTMPSDATMSTIHYSGFGPEYTADYLKQAMREMYPELLSRDDVTPAMLETLQAMRDYLAKHCKLRIDNTPKLTKE